MKFISISPPFHVEFIMLSLSRSMLCNVMNETTKTSTPSQDTKTNAAEIASCWANRIAGPAVTMISCGLIIGLALTGLALMGISAATWLLSGADWFCGIGLLTGGLFLSSATVLFLGQLSRAGDAIYRNSRLKKKLQSA